MHRPPADVESAARWVDPDDICTQRRQGRTTQRRRDEGRKFDDSQAGEQRSRHAHDPRMRRARSATGLSTNSPPAVRVAAPPDCPNAESTSFAHFRSLAECVARSNDQHREAADDPAGDTKNVKNLADDIGQWLPDGSVQNCLFPKALGLSLSSSVHAAHFPIQPGLTSKEFPFTPIIDCSSFGTPVPV